MTSFVVGGVPEPMNLPWQLAVSDGTFANEHLDVEWVDQPGGTGAIAGALSERTLDAATILTEGAIAAIVNGADLRIEGTPERGAVRKGTPEKGRPTQPDVTGSGAGKSSWRGPRQVRGFPPPGPYVVMASAMVSPGESA